MSNLPLVAQFYRSLLQLHGPNTRTLVEQSLQLALEATRARVGYVELWDDENEAAFARLVGLGHIEEIQRRISRGIISKAIIEGVPLVTSSALADARFKDLESVRQHEIRSVLCVPVVTDEVIGVLYFEATESFEADGVRDIDLFGRELAKIANRIVTRSKLSLLELTSEFRVQTIDDALERHDHNVSAAAKELRITRKTFYRIAGTNLRRTRRS